MPRKQRQAKFRRELPLTPAARFLLMTGRSHAVHVCGASGDHRWRCEVDRALVPCVTRGTVAGAWQVLLDEGYLDAVWAEHGADLIVEARRHGFEAAGLDGAAVPEAVTREWRRAFLAEVDQ
jgi:hypothetical protein